MISRRLLLLIAVGVVAGCATASKSGPFDAGPDGESEAGPLPDGATPAEDGGADSSTPAVARVFTTATTYAAKSLGGGASGFAGADGFCANAAAAAGLGGTWVAWLSTAKTNAIDRVTGQGPWYLVDGTTLVFANKAALATVPRTGISKNELGLSGQVAREVWTGTANGGVASSFTCNDWTNGTNTGEGTVGIGGQTQEWTKFLEQSCDGERSIYCFEVK